MADLPEGTRVIYTPSWGPELYGVIQAGADSCGQGRLPVLIEERRVDGAKTSHHGMTLHLPPTHLTPAEGALF